MAKLGLIVPSSNTTMEPEFYGMLPKGFTVHTARLRLRKLTVNELAGMVKELEKEAVKLADAGVNVIAFGCTSGSLIKGPSYGNVIERMIESASRKPAVAASNAVINALNALNVKKVVVATPYTDEINDLEAQFLKANGFKVLELKGLGLLDNVEIENVNGETIIELVRGMKHGDADGVLLSCTNLPTAKIIEKLEDSLGKPVISSNTATLWAMLKKCGVSVRIKGYGRLLEGPI